MEGKDRTDEKKDSRWKHVSPLNLSARCSQSERKAFPLSACDCDDDCGCDDVCLADIQGNCGIWG
jgi:hypothetical protein